MSNRSRMQKLHWFIVLALVLTAAAQALGAGVVVASQTTPRPQTVAGQAEAPPVLLSSEPQGGTAWDGSPVVFTFDKPMASATIAVTPELAGETTVDGTGVVFTPTDTPAANTRYRFTVAEAQATDGTTLAAAVEISLQVAGPLSVVASQPSDGAEESDPNNPIVVIFNRPVVPLTGVDDQASLPQPLTFDPPVEGQGTWISTSVYQFEPAAPLGGGTTYQVTVEALTDVAGESMAEPYTFQFTTAAPIVLQSSPSGIFVRPDRAVEVTFSQPMDPASTEAAFSLGLTGEGEPVAGAFTWNITGTVVIFTPTVPLAYGGEYTIRVAASAQPASRQGSLRDAYSSSFTVVPLPAVASTSILDGAAGVNPESELRVRFTAPVSDTTLLANIRIETPISGTNVVSYTYSDYYENTNQNAQTIAENIPFGYNTHLMLNWYKEPNTTYTVTIGSAVEDQFGNQTGEDYALVFTTGDYSPLVQIDLERFTHYSAFTTTVVGVKYRNVDTVDAELFHLPLADLYLLGGQNQWQVWDTYEMANRDQNRIWAKSLPAEGDPNVIHLLGFRLVDGDGNPLPPGVYMLEVRNPPAIAQAGGQDMGMPQQPPTQRAIIVLSNNNITIKRGSQGESLAWVSGLQDGQPVPGAPVVFNRDATELAQATTDGDGIATAALDLGPDSAYVPVFATSGQPGDPGFAVVSTEWNQGIEPWSWNFATGGGYDQVVINLYSERPIYRPGQTVYWKGIVRVLRDDVWSLPDAGTQLEVLVNNTLGNVIFKDHYTVNEFGTIDGEFPLAPDALTGYYSLSASLPQGKAGAASGNTSFQVAAYRTPEFQITLATSKPEYTQGETVTATVQADYFSGGPLAGAPVEWRLIAGPYSFTWPDAPGGRFYTFDPYDPDQQDFDPYAAGVLGLLQEGKGQTDADGTFVIELPADLGNALASQRWSLDVVITSPTQQQVYNNVSFPVHRGEYYIGLSPRSNVAETGTETTVDLVTITPDYEPYPEADLDVVIYEVVWNSVYEQAEDGNFYWRTSAQRTPVVTTTVTTDGEGNGTIAFTPETGGQYQITAAGEDEAGNLISTAVFLYASASDDSYVAWPRENNDRIDLVADQASYEPGDIARVLIPNPFSGTVKALVTLERSGVLEAHVQELTGSSQTIEVPITGAHIPNVYVGVVLVKGIDESNPYPATRVGYVKLTVDTSEKALAIDIEPSATTVRPGDTVSFTLTIRDDAGNPVPNVETSVALVDKAVLVLGAQYMDTRSLLDIFYYERPLGVSTGSLIVINKDRVSAQLAKGGKGGGGGDGGGGPEIREDFPDTAFWRADLVSDDNGVIEFSVTLPDNLTTWVLTAKGVSTETLVGEATNEIVATKELQVRPALPRFFTSGDRSIAGGVVLNTTDATLDGTFTVAVDGATLEDGQAEQSFSAEPNVPLSFDFPITVDAQAAAVVVTMTAQAGDLSDGVRITLPVLRYQTPEVVGTSGVVPPSGVTEAIYVPTQATDDGELLVTLDASLAAGLVEGLTYLEHFPYECNEQTVSRFLPNLFTVRALRELDVEDPQLESKLNYQLGIGVQSLVTRQNPDGGWGYWPQQASQPFITAYVLWGLWSATELGYTIDDSVLQRGITYLDGQFQAPSQVRVDWMLNEMAFMHYVLAQLDAGDAGRMSTLYEVRERLEPYGKAFLAMALHTMNEQDERVATLLDDLLGAAVITASGASWQDEAIDYQTMSSDIRTTAVVLAAFLQIQPDQPLLPNVVRWLMSAREAGRWATTQENAWSIIALTDWMTYTGELQTNYDWRVTLGADELGSGRFTDPTEQVELAKAVAELLRDQANLLVIERSDEPGQLYYTTYLHYYLDALAVEPANHGMVVERRFSLDGEPASTVQVGDVVSVTVTIVAPSDLYHVMVEAPIPAGVEPLDPALPTGFQYDQQGQPVLTPLDASQGGWYNWTPAFLDYRDDRVAMFATYLPAGTYEYTFQVRAAVPGEYRVLPVHGEMMYFPEVWGRSGGQLFTVTR